MTVTIKQFAKSLSASGLMSADEVRAFLDDLPPGSRPENAQQLARSLVHRNKLTQYQAAAVYQGKTKGLVLGEYTVLDRIGQGGMGQVLKAQHRAMDRIVALKILPRKTMRSSDAIKRFRREVRAAAKLVHPNIVMAYDAGEHEGIHYLVMEYVEGQDLASIVKAQGRLSVEQALDCIIQAARGLEHAHEHGVIHRDVKPGNLLLEKEGIVKVLDMGLARLTVPALAADAVTGEQLTESGQVMGTYHYMAPEQAENTHGADLRADVYSLGCTLFKLLTGESPYARETVIQTLLAHRDAKTPSLSQSRSDVPATVDAVFQKMVAKKPEDRYQSMSEVITALEACDAARESIDRLTTDGPSTDSALRLFLQNLSQRETHTRAEASSPLGDTLAYCPQQDPDVASERGTLPAPRRSKRLVLGIGAGVGILFVLLGCMLMFIQRPGTLVIETISKDVQIAVKQNGELVAVADAKLGWKVTLSAGEYALELKGSKDQFQLDRDVITVQRGEQVIVRVNRKRPRNPPPLAVAPFDADQATQYQQRWADYLGIPRVKTDSIGMEFVLIPPGRCRAGSTDAEIERLKREATDQKLPTWYSRHIQRESPQYGVTIARPFYLGKYEVTVAQFRTFVEATGYQTEAEENSNITRFFNPKSEGEMFSGGWKTGAECSWQNPGFTQKSDHPVVSVTYNDMRAFCRWRSKEEKQTYRLPTEAEWEYACRAGTTTRWSVGDEEEMLQEIANIPDASLKLKFPVVYWAKPWNDEFPFTAPVGHFRPNPFGLHDMHGNATELCRVWHGKDYDGSTLQPPGSSRELAYATRGGAWNDPVAQCRAAIAHLVEHTHSNTGCRVIVLVQR